MAKQSHIQKMQIKIKHPASIRYPDQTTIVMITLVSFHEKEQPTIRIDEANEQPVLEQLSRDKPIFLYTCKTTHNAGVHVLFVYLDSHPMTLEPGEANIMFEAQVLQATAFDIDPPDVRVDND
jgi:hypothetical protein